jgi:hypothetical protein
MFPLPNLSCGEHGIFLSSESFPAGVKLTFPEPGRFRLAGSFFENGVITAIDRTHNTIIFDADAEDRDASTPYFDGTVYLRFDSLTNGTFAVKHSETKGTNYGTFVTFNTEPELEGPPAFDPNLTAKTLSLNYCPNGFETIQFTSETRAIYDRRAVGSYTYDHLTGQLQVTLDNGWLFEITLGKTMAKVTFKDVATGETLTQIATYALH